MGDEIGFLKEQNNKLWKVEEFQDVFKVWRSGFDDSLKCFCDFVFVSRANTVLSLLTESHSFPTRTTKPCALPPGRLH